MRLLIPFLLFSILTKAQNPVFPGWYADPEGVIFDKQYWIYPTYSAKYNEQVFLDAFSSTDLVKWTKHECIIDTSRVKWARRAMWAPAIVQKDGKYFLFFSANDIQNDNEAGGIGIAVASKPEGPFDDYLKKPLISKFINGAQPIDQFVFRDGDAYYMIYGGWRHCNIGKLKPDFTGFVPFEDGNLFKEITPDQYVEGPFMFKRDGKYYFMWSEGGWTGPDYFVAYAVADSPLGPFKRAGRVLQQNPKIANGAGHHSILHPPNSDKWYIVYHRRPLGETDRNARVVCIEEMKFDKEGRIMPVEITVEGVKANSIANTQVTIDSAKEAAKKYRLGQYSYHEKFIGHPGYGAPTILTADGGAALYGDGEYNGVSSGVLVKLDKMGKEQWQRPIKMQFSEMESQSVVQDKAGNFYVFMLSYDEKRYRGGSERIIYIDKTGAVKWDKTIGNYTLMNNPTIAYIRAENDGRIYMRGQTVIDKPVEGKDPKYRFWEGWINSTGKLTEKTGEVIVWGNNQPWQKFFAPEK